MTIFDMLKFSLAARHTGHKQRKLNDHVYSFLLFVSSGPHARSCDFLYKDHVSLKYEFVDMKYAFTMFSVFYTFHFTYKYRK